MAIFASDVVSVAQVSSSLFVRFTIAKLVTTDHEFDIFRSYECLVRLDLPACQWTEDDKIAFAR